MKAIVLVLFVLPAQAQTIYSKHFETAGICTGNDELAVLHSGPKGKKGHLQLPWEAVPIRIVGVEITVEKGSEYLGYAFAGNGYSPDIMLMVGRGSPGRSHFFPAGTFFPFPAEGAPPPAHVDLHVKCDAAPWWRFSRNRFRMWYVVYYTKGS